MHKKYWGLYSRSIVKICALFLFVGCSTYIHVFSWPKLRKQKRIKELPKLPIIYRSDYTISLFGGVESWMHLFDGYKYKKIASHLKKVFSLSDAQLYKPDMVSDIDLLKVHTAEYLDSLKSSSTIAHIAEVSFLNWFPHSYLQRNVLSPMRYATQGTIDAVELALQKGIAFNLSGGYHHARYERQFGGFCFFADIPLAILKAREKYPDLGNVLVVDLDAHRGNGVAQVRDYLQDKKTFIFDMYSASNYPGDLDLKFKYRDDRYIPLRDFIDTEEYLTILKNNLIPMVDIIKPDLIIYNAGSDPYEGDALGRMKMSAKGIIERDAHVFSVARALNIPIAMVLSGGYSKDSAAIVADSIENLMRTYIKK